MSDPATSSPIIGHHSFWPNGSPILVPNSSAGQKLDGSTIKQSPHTLAEYQARMGTFKETIKVKYLVEGMTPLKYIGEGKSDWVDLRASEDMRIWKGDFVLIPLGVAIQLPAGYEALIAPRGSTFKTWGLLEANSIGVVDESYCGDGDMWHMPVFATQNVVVHKNDRICQFRIIEHQPQLIFETVEHLGNPDRSGFGSTGHK